MTEEAEQWGPRAPPTTGVRGPITTDQLQNPIRGLAFQDRLWDSAFHCLEAEPETRLREQRCTRWELVRAGRSGGEGTGQGRRKGEDGRGLRLSPAWT